MTPPQKKPLKSVQMSNKHISLFTPHQFSWEPRAEGGNPLGQECEVMYPLRKPGSCLRALSQYSKLLHLQAQVPPHSKFGCLVKK